MVNNPITLMVAKKMLLFAMDASWGLASEGTGHSDSSRASPGCFWLPGGSLVSLLECSRGQGEAGAACLLESQGGLP